MRYRILSEDGDMTFGSGSLNFFIDSPDAVAQLVLTNLKLWVGEWFLDLSEGTPFAQAVLGMNKKETATPAIRNVILNTNGVKSIISFSENIDPNERRYSFSAIIDTIYGQTTLTGVL